MASSLRCETRTGFLIMEIKGKVHCFFEQSGIFKKEFVKLGIPAYDYDIRDDFGETDYIIDLFEEIEKAYAGEPSKMDSISPDDVTLAFFSLVCTSVSTM